MIPFATVVHEPVATSSSRRAPAVGFAITTARPTTVGPTVFYESRSVLVLAW
jgi:hypothetical protein